MRLATLALAALAAVAAAPASVSARSLKQDATKPVSWKQGDSLPAITLPTLAQVQSFLASPEVKQVQSWIAEAPPLPKPQKPAGPPKREPKAHRAPHGGRHAEQEQAAEDVALPAEGGQQQQPGAEGVAAPPQN